MPCLLFTFLNKHTRQRCSTIHSDKNSLNLHFSPQNNIQHEAQQQLKKEESIVQIGPTIQFHSLRRPRMATCTNKKQKTKTEKHFCTHHTQHSTQKIHRIHTLLHYNTIYHHIISFAACFHFFLMFFCSSLLLFFFFCFCRSIQTRSRKKS